MISFKTIYYEGIEPSIQDKIKNATSFEQALDLICSDAKLFINFIYKFGFDVFSGYFHILEKNEHSIAKYPWPSAEYAKVLIENDKPVSEIIEQGIAQYPDYLHNYVKFLIKNNKSVSEAIEKSIIQNSDYSLEYAKLLIENDKPVSEIIERGVAQYKDRAYLYAKFLIKNNKPVPEIIQQSAENLTK